MIFTMLCGLLFGSDGYYVALAWSSCALMFFIVSNSALTDIIHCVYKSEVDEMSTLFSETEDWVTFCSFWSR